MCSAATYNPPFDMSGVQTTDGDKQVFLDNSGKFYYFDEDGKKVYVDPAKDTFVDIRKGLQYKPDYFMCYTDGTDVITLGAVVRRDEDLEIKSIKYIVEDTTDLDNPDPSMQFMAVRDNPPEGWTKIPCQESGDCGCGVLSSTDIDEVTPIPVTP